VKISEIPGCGPVIEKKLDSIGIVDVNQLITNPPPRIAAKTGMDNESAKELYFKARKFLEKKKMVAKRFRTGTEIEGIGETFITTGTKSLNKLLNGGLRLGACTVVYGEDGCGKTQFAHTMAVRTQLPEDQGGLNGKVIWLDTENTFKKDRIIDIAQHYNLSPTKCLDNIIVAKPHNSADQQVTLEEAERLIIEDKSIKLVIIDSAIGLFRGDYSGLGELSERQKYLDNFLTLSQNIAKHYNIATIWTNQVMINPVTFMGDPLVPVGGKILGHKATFIIYFRKSGKKRVGILKKSPNDAQIEVTFGISTEGMVDPEVIDEIEKEKKKAKTKKEE